MRGRRVLNIKFSVLSGKRCRGQKSRRRRTQGRVTAMGLLSRASVKKRRARV
jgi:hypothetical protein